MYAELFIRQAPWTSLDAFVIEFARAFSCGPFEERESSNYVEERYFTAPVLGLELTLALADAREFDTYTFWLVLDGDGRLKAKPFVDDLADHLARQLAAAGAEVARPMDPALADSPTVFYKPGPPLADGHGHEVLIETR